MLGLHGRLTLWVTASAARQLQWQYVWLLTWQHFLSRQLEGVSDVQQSPKGTMHMDVVFMSTTKWKLTGIMHMIQLPING